MISGESLCVACVPTKISNLFSLGYFRWFPARCTKKKSWGKVVGLIVAKMFTEYVR